MCDEEFTPKSLIAENKRRNCCRVRNHIKVILSDQSYELEFVLEFFSINLMNQSSYQNNTLRCKSTKTLMSPRYSNVTANIRGYGYTISVTQFQIHLFDSQGVPQNIYRRVKTRACANPYAQALKSRNPQVDHNNIHQVTQLDSPMSLQISSCKTHIKCSQILKDSIR